MKTRRSLLKMLSGAITGFFVAPKIAKTQVHKFMDDLEVEADPNVEPLDLCDPPSMTPAIADDEIVRAERMFKRYLLTLSNEELDALGDQKWKTLSIRYAISNEQYRRGYFGHANEPQIRWPVGEIATMRAEPGGKS